jgi:hypothetical protein
MEVDVPTSTSRLTRLLASDQIWSCLGYIIHECMVQALSTIILLLNTFPKVSQVTKMKIICKRYAIRKLTYHLRTSRFIKLLAFHLLHMCLGNTLSEFIVYNLFIFVLIDDTFPMDSRVTQMEIDCMQKFFPR